jgi:hypothetical protein
MMLHPTHLACCRCHTKSNASTDVAEQHIHADNFSTGKQTFSRQVKVDRSKDEVIQVLAPPVVQAFKMRQILVTQLPTNTICKAFQDGII